MPPRPRLLYISPVVPATTGNGLAMRAGTVLRMLAQRYEVWLVVVPLYASPFPGLSAEVAACCRAAAVVPPTLRAKPHLDSRPAGSLGRLRSWLGRALRPTGEAATQVGLPFLDQPFDVVHVFRLAALPVAAHYGAPTGRRPKHHLDLDDVESTTRRRLADLYAQNGEAGLARQETMEAARYTSLENSALRDLDRVYVCSERDRQALLGRGQAEVLVLPNALPLPAPLPPPPAEEPFTLLFVGTLGYYPNEDALRFFCGEVLPHLRRLARAPVRLDVVGVGTSSGVEALRSVLEVRLIGAVSDLAPYYARAHAVIVPIRAGGGTRIKILEAFAYRRPVVSTTIGAEGIGAGDGEHLLLGDSAEAFATQCARLLNDQALRERLAERAFELFRQMYSLEAVGRVLSKVDQGVSPLPERLVE